MRLQSHMDPVTLIPTIYFDFRRLPSEAQQARSVPDLKRHLDHILTNSYTPFHEFFHYTQFLGHGFLRWYSSYAYTVAMATARDAIADYSTVDEAAPRDRAIFTLLYDRYECGYTPDSNPAVIYGDIQTVFTSSPFGLHLREPVDHIRMGRSRSLGIIDLIESAACLADWQMVMADTAPDKVGSPTAYSSWCKRNAVHRAALDFAADCLGAQLSHRLFLPLVAASLEFTHPLPAFVIGLSLLQTLTLGTPHLFDEMDRWEDGRSEIWDDAISALVAQMSDLQFVFPCVTNRMHVRPFRREEFREAYRHPLVGDHVERWIRWSRTQPESRLWLTNPARLGPEWRYQLSVEFEPPITFYRLLNTPSDWRVDHARPGTIFSGRPDGPLFSHDQDARVGYMLVITAYSIARGLMNETRNSPQHACPHEACPQRRRGLCSSFPYFPPEAFRDCPFPSAVDGVVSSIRRAIEHDRNDKD